MNKPIKHIFVCTSSRMTGVAKGFCHTKGALEIIQRFTEKLEEENITDVMVSNTGCFGICEKGPIVAVYPDNVWYGSVSADDVDEIVESHIMNGKIVEKLEI
jgi:(2Fe-2S) ferredoxin